MKKIFGFAAAATLLAGMSFAQTATTTSAPSGSDNKTDTQKQTQPASSDMKEAGNDTQDVGTAMGKAGKAVGRATKKGVKTGYRHTKHGLKTAADKTSNALSDEKKPDDKKDQAAPANATNPPASPTPPADTTTPPASTTQPK